MFKLEFDIPKPEKEINIDDPICLMGSCFSNEIGTLLSQNKFQVLSNPFGTIYNPHSIFKLLLNQVKGENSIESQGIFYHWDSHGVVSGLTAEEAQTLFSQKRNELQAFLSKAKWLVITPGTAMVYEHQEVGIVSNCHKVPSSSFEKRFLTQKEIIEHFARLHRYLEDINPSLNILFTVSPVRHIKEGLVENNRSKAILLDAVHTIVEQYENTSYFPSYEVLIDELRDYRFYVEDMIHPSSQAISYVWSKFGESYFDEGTLKVLLEWERLRTAINHRPFQPQSTSHQNFLKNTLSKLMKMNEKIDVSVEIEQIRNQIQ